MFWELSRFYKFSAFLWFGTPFFEWYADSWRESGYRSIPVSRFSVRFRSEPEFGRLKSIGLPFSGFDRSDRWIWFHRIRDFRSIDGISVCRFLCRTGRPVDLVATGSPGPPPARTGVGIDHRVRDIAEDRRRGGRSAR